MSVEVARAIRLERERQEKIDRDADCVQRDLYDLVERGAFMEVTGILKRTREYMDDAFEILQAKRRSG